MTYDILDMVGFANMWGEVPIDFDWLYMRYAITKIPMTKLMEKHKLSRLDMFLAMAKSNDGCAVRSKDGRYTVIYNDKSHPHRIRFTLAEEFAHIFFGHLLDPTYSVRENWDDDTYQLCEEEAHIGANILLCPPAYYYQEHPGIDELVCRFRVSELCARNIIRFYTEAEDVIVNSEIYQQSKQFCVYKKFLYGNKPVRIGIYPTREEMLKYDL